MTHKMLWTTKFDPAYALAFSPDSKHICVAGKIDVFRLDATIGKLDPWDPRPDDDKVIHFGKMHALAYHPEGIRLAASDGYVTKVRPLKATGEEVSMAGPPTVRNKAGELPAGVAWSKDGKRLATHPSRGDRRQVGGRAVGRRQRRTDDAPFRTRPARGSGSVVGRRQGHRVRRHGRSRHPVGRGERQGHPDGSPPPRAAADTSLALTLSPDGKTVGVAFTWTAANSGKRVARRAVRLCGTDDGEPLAWLKDDTGPPFVSLAFSPDGRTLYVAGVAGGTRRAGRMPRRPGPW